MKIVVLTNGSKHGLEIIRQLKADAIKIDCVLLEKKMIRKKEFDLLKSKLGKASFILPLIPFKNQIYRLFRNFKYNDTSIKTLNEYCSRIIKVTNLTGLQSEKILSKFQPDLIVLGGSRIIKKNILDIPTIGTLNAHPGMLPYYRGLDVIQWALFNGDVPGVTVHYVNAGIDTGAICTQQELQINKSNSIAEIKDQAVNLGAQLMSKTVNDIIKNGGIDTIPNESDIGKYYQKMPKDILEKLLKTRSQSE